MTGQERSCGSWRASSQLRHIPPAVKHFPPVVVDCFHLRPPCPGPLSAVQGWLAAEMLSCFQSMLPLMESRGQQCPQPFSVHTPLGAAGPLLTHRWTKKPFQTHTHTPTHTGCEHIQVHTGQLSNTFICNLHLSFCFLYLFYIILNINLNFLKTLFRFICWFNHSWNLD